MEKLKEYKKAILAAVGGIIVVGINAAIQAAQDYEPENSTAGVVVGAVITVLLVMFGPRNEQPPAS